MTEWFEEWFGEEYLRLYPHRDETDAARMVRLIDAHLPLKGRRVLDLACGPGRHARAMVKLGAAVVGFDLSMPLLRRARRCLSDPPRLVRGDMRCLPFAPHSFDMVVNLFTSFGYFVDDRQHESVLQAVAAVLRNTGGFVLDYLNAEHVRRTLVPHEEHTVGRRRVATERRFSPDGRFVVKEMHLVDEGHSFLERVRLFAPRDLESMLVAAGLTVLDRLGDYDGSPLGPESPRAILIAAKS